MLFINNGEMGRGFSDVAEENRKLAEDSIYAVSTINSSLYLYTHGVNSMVSQVNDQFIELENGTENISELEKVVLFLKNELKRYKL